MAPLRLLPLLVVFCGALAINLDAGTGSTGDADQPVSMDPQLGAERRHEQREDEDWQHKTLNMLRNPDLELHEEKRRWQEDRTQWQEDRTKWEEDRTQWEEDRTQWQEDRTHWEEDRTHWEEDKRQLLKQTHSMQSDILSLKLAIERILQHCDNTNAGVSENTSNLRKQSEPQPKQRRRQTQTSRPPSQPLDSLVLDDDDKDPMVAVVAQLSQRVGEVGAEVQALKNADTQHDSAIADAGSTTFVRWGKSTCPNSTALVYAGRIGGSYYHSGGSSNTVLCLPSAPVLGTFFDRPSDIVSQLYGAEFYTNDLNHFLDPACSVCRTHGRSLSLMVPATTVCPADWFLDYSGFLMGSYPGDPVPHDFVCVDSAMEPMPSSQGDQPALRLFYTYTNCGSLPCPPYANNKLVPCVVCSQ